MKPILTLIRISLRRRWLVSLGTLLLAIVGLGCACVGIHWNRQSILKLTFLPSILYMSLTVADPGKDVIPWLLSMPFTRRQIVSSRYLLTLFRVLLLTGIWSLAIFLCKVFSWWKVILLLALGLVWTASLLWISHQDLLEDERRRKGWFIVLLMLGHLFFYIVIFIANGQASPQLTLFMACLLALSILYYAMAWRRSWKNFEIWEW